MAQTANINIRIDRDLKERAETVLDDMGLNMTTAVNLFLRQVLRQGKIPFEICSDPFYSQSNLEHLRRGAAAIDAGLGVEHELIEVDG